MIASFSPTQPAQTPGEVAGRLGMSRSTARRILLTLEELGYADQAPQGFRLTPKVLDLGYSYVSSLRVTELARQPLERLAGELEESSAMSVLEAPEIVFVAHVPAPRLMSPALGPGSRLPAHATAMGRVLLAGFDDKDVEECLSKSNLVQLTPLTITDPQTLLAKIAEARAGDHALVDEELEVGVRSLAVPVVDSRGNVVAAVGVSCPVIRVSVERLRSEFLPKLLAAVGEISAAARAVGRIC